MPRSPVIEDLQPEQTIQRRLAEAEEAQRNRPRVSTGAPGAPGATGPEGKQGTSAGLVYKWSPTTTESNPGKGKFRLNNSTWASATRLFMSEFDNYEKDVSAVLKTWGEVENSFPKFYLLIRGVNDYSKYMYLKVETQRTDEGEWDKWTITFISSSGTFEENELFSIVPLIRGDRGEKGEKGFEGSKGEKGETGATGAQGASSGIPWKYAEGSVLEVNPGLGNIAANSLTFASVTKLFVNETSLGGNVEKFLETWQESTSTVKGFIYMEVPGSPSKFALFQLSSRTDNGAWDTLGVTPIASSGFPFGTSEVRVGFLRTGDKGTAGTNGAEGKEGKEGKEGPPGSTTQADYLASVRAATTANITISTALNPGDSLDGVTLAENDRVLVKDQTTKSENGIWRVAAVPVRTTDADAAGELSGGTQVSVEEGTRNKRRTFKIITPGSITPGTTAHEWQALAPRDFGILESSAAVGTASGEAVIGDVARYKAATGVFWDMVYSGEATYPWAVVGGTPLIEEVETQQSTKSGEYTNLATEGPKITAPLKGFYDVRLNHLFLGEGHTTGYMSFTLGAAEAKTAVDKNAAIASQPNNAFFAPNTGTRTSRVEISAAATAVIARYKTSNGAVENKFQFRKMELMPTRVG